MAEKGANLLRFGPPCPREIPSRSGARSGLDREGLACPLHQNHRSRPETSDRAAISPSKPQSPNSTNIYLLILDDLAYVTKDQAETSVLFEFDQRAIPALIPAHHRKSALRRMGEVPLIRP